MDTFWLKIAGFVVVIIVVIIGVMMVMPAKEEKPPEPQKTFGDMVQKDKKIITAEPNAGDLTQQAAEEQTPAEPEKAAEPVTFYFTELTEAEKIGAENIFATVPSFKSIGRLPYMGYNTMVQACRQLMSRFPGSIYDYKARRALAQVPEQYWTRYKITEELIDLTPFTQQRPNTHPYKIQEDN
ncbi:MAG: hypothetical protein JW804_01895 [Sedimentisphaerales bacterium]|nr:hypothetical protein [Sedimentisphaerales bacterium]